MDRPNPSPNEVENPAAATPGESARRPWGFWGALGWFLVISLAATGAQLVAFIGGAIWMVARGLELNPDALGKNSAVLGAAVLLSMPVAVGLAWFVARLRLGTAGAREFLGLKSVPVRTMFRCCALLLALVACFDATSALLNRPIVPEFMREVYQSDGSFALLALAILAAAPLAEEVVFRGFLIGGLQRSWIGPAGAIAVSSLFWAIIHLQYDPLDISMIFVGGLVLGWTRWKTGSIYPAIAMHALMNLVATIQVIVWSVAAS